MYCATVTGGVEKEISGMTTEMKEAQGTMASLKKVQLAAPLTDCQCSMCSSWLCKSAGVFAPVLHIEKLLSVPSLPTKCMCLSVPIFDQQLNSAGAVWQIWGLHKSGRRLKGSLMSLGTYVFQQGSNLIFATF